MTMPSLTIQLPDSTRRGAFAGRVLIGRVPGNGVVLPFPDVSRLHAWVGTGDDGPYIADAFSRTGVRVNGQKVNRRQVLRDGDIIEIATGRLTFNAHSDAEEDLQDDLKYLSRGSGGVVFDCACGAPIWAPESSIGHRGKCSHCQRRLLIPEESGGSAVVLVAGEGAVAERTAVVSDDTEVDHGASVRYEAASDSPGEPCSICQTSFASGDQRSTCPDCGLIFHSDCWTENRGCSAYGCGQVGALDQASTAAVDTSDIGDAGELSGSDEVSAERVDEQGSESLAEGPHSTWNMALLAGSIVAAGVGALLFGSLSAGLVGVTIGVLTRRTRRSVWVWTSLVISIIGTAAGVVVSRWCWMGKALPGMGL